MMPRGNADMLKMTITLAIALYAAFVVWGEPTSDPLTADRSTRETVLAGASPDYAKPVILSADPSTGATVTRAAVTEVVVPDAAVIAASAPAPDAPTPRLIGEPVVVNLVVPSAQATEQAAGPANDGAEDLYRVSGSRVNMRAGPSTSNPVLDSLPGGTLAEVIGGDLDGWVRIRDIASGQTGYMAARFLEPA